jgi:hypothetical protein
MGIASSAAYAFVNRPNLSSEAARAYYRFGRLFASEVPMLKIILIAISLLLPEANAFAADSQPPPKADQHGAGHDCGRQQDQTSWIVRPHRFA